MNGRPRLAALRPGIASGLVGMAAFLLVTANAASAQDARRFGDPSPSQEFHLSDGADLSGVRAAYIDPARLKPGFRRVSDLHLRLSSQGGPVDALLASPDENQPLRGRNLFRAQLYAVVDGQLHTGATAWCGGWRANASRCEIDCDGGSFSLVRDPPVLGKSHRMQLVIEGGDDGGYGEPGGLSLSACAFETGTDVRLIPAAGRQNYAATFSSGAITR